MQNLISEEEFVDLMSALRTTLPTTFRFTGGRETAIEQRDAMMHSFFNNLEEIRPTTIKWYPSDLGWEINCPRSILRKSPGLAKFHRFLISETEVGNISRQEAVSMIPVLLMDIKPGFYVLDMCAAPGSKTAQILESLTNDDPMASNHLKVTIGGVVIANDANAARSHMLVKQAKRLQSPCLMVTNHSAQSFPQLHIECEGTEKYNPLRFDRILADVPCSGDGTFRKNLNLWRTWAVQSGNGLHKLQCMILQRGCELLKVGGRIVYSTCSMNPIENEAVVAEIIRRSEGAIELVDVSDNLTGLKRNPGVLKWMMKDREGSVYKSFEEVPEEKKKYTVESMFPPKDIESFGIEKCLRIYPHLQNTGGFFVAVMQKITELPKRVVLAENLAPNADKDSKEEVNLEEETTAEEEVDEDTLRNKRAKIDDNQTVKQTHVAWSSKGESPLIFLNTDHELVINARKVYGLENGFPLDQFVVRNFEDKNKSIYFVGESVKKILLARNSRKLKIINTGIKAFTHQSMASISADEFKYRLNNEGLLTLAPYLSDRKRINCSLGDLLVAISNSYPKFSAFSDDFRAILEKLAISGYLLVFNPADHPDYTGSIKLPVYLPMWRAAVSVSTLISKQERASLMFRLTGQNLELNEKLDDLPKITATDDTH
jgi:16S rRNA C967 or C1407 C5-methylase (RsmB/RsmF family)